MLWTARVWLLGFAPLIGLQAQTTQGMIFGRTVDSLSGNVVAGAAITCVNLSTRMERYAVADASGSYMIGLLSPGMYRVRVERAGYQGQDLSELELPVAGTRYIEFRIRPLSDVWEQSQRHSVFLPGNSVLPFYGPDVDNSRTGNFESDLGLRGALQSTVSQVIEPGDLRDLPLAGRDVYALLVTMPGVATDTSTARGLGLTVNGQRPSSSNFLLDGLENNNYLITGPLTTVAPEAIQEYRVSTNNFSPEYGGTSGFVANAVTRAGSRQWHGLGYFYMKNDALNANDFQHNRDGVVRTPVKEVQPGFSTTGPLPVRNLYASGSFEYLRFRSFGEPQLNKLPTANFKPPQGSFAKSLLQGYTPPAGSGMTAVVSIARPSSLSRVLALPRLDYTMGQGSHRIFARGAITSLERPDFIWSPYPEFSSPLTQSARSVGGGWLGTLRPHVTLEARFGWQHDDLHFDRARPEIPALGSSDQTKLPGSPAFYSYRNQGRTLEYIGNLLWMQGKHVWKFGAGGLSRGLDGYLTAGVDGYYIFPSLDDFAAGTPSQVRVALSRTEFAKGNYVLPDDQRSYSYGQLFWFAQDSYRASSRLVFNYGIRFERSGAPRNTGDAKDTFVVPGAGRSLADQLATATVQQQSRQNAAIYATDNGNWAPRAGFSYGIRRDRRTLLRGSYGIFYDRPFDNLWQNVRNNGSVLSVMPYAGTIITPIADVLPLLRDLDPDRNVSRMNLFAATLHAPMVQVYFLGIEHQFTPPFTVEVNGLGALGRRLITTDIVNRDLFNTTTLPKDVFYRANQGSSDYHGMAVSARYRGRRLQSSLTYTWSHSIDNQSEPLRGDFYDLSATRPGAIPGSGLQSTFSRQFDWNADRGNSDFDQRHNLVFFAIWDIPPALSSTNKAAVVVRDWRVAGLFGAHSGFPFTVTSNLPGSQSDDPGIRDRRADLVDPELAYAAGQDVPGGRKLLNPAAFRRSPAERQGNTGRNAFTGPGFYNLDLSVARTFRLGESRALTFRADAFNALNHANLDTPVTALGQNFGEAQFGRTGVQPAFPALVPFRETARQLQLMLRFEF